MIRSFFETYKLLLLVTSLLFISIVSCGSDPYGKGEGGGPGSKFGQNYQKLGQSGAEETLDQTLEDEPLSLTFGSHCQNQWNLKTNHANILQTDNGFRIDGSLFLSTELFGDIRIANGTTYLTNLEVSTSGIETDATYKNLIGQSHVILPLYGVLEKFTTGQLPYAALSVRQGSELQELGFPIQDDSRCYLYFETSSELNLAGGFALGIPANTHIIIDPLKGTFYVKANMSGLPGFSNIEDAAIGVSATGALSMTPRAGSFKKLEGHLYFEASMEPPALKGRQIEGEVIINLDPSDDYSKMIAFGIADMSYAGSHNRALNLVNSLPDIIIGVNGSLYSTLDALEIASDIGIVDGSDSIMVGEGTMILSSVEGSRVDFALEKGSFLTQLIGVTPIGDILQPGTTNSISGYFSDDPDFSLTYATGFQLKNHELTGGQIIVSPQNITGRGALEWGPFDFSVSGTVSYKGSFDFEGTASINPSVTLIGITAEVDIDADLSFTNTAFDVSGDFKACIESACISGGLSVGSNEVCIRISLFPFDGAEYCFP